MRKTAAISVSETFPYSILEREKSFVVEATLKNLVRVKYYCKKAQFPDIASVKAFMEIVFSRMK